MLWQTHLRIVNEVLFSLRISKGSVEAAQLREGVLAPDKWGNYPHHYGKSRDIRDYLLNARKFFLRNDLRNAYFSLGVALHYIQDSYTSLSSRSSRHSSWERQIEEAGFATGLESLVQWAFRDRKDKRKKYSNIMGNFREVSGERDTLELATLLGHNVPVYGNPKVDLNFGYWASFFVAKSVLGATVNGKLQDQLVKLQAESEVKMKIAEAEFVCRLVAIVEKRDDLHSRSKSSSKLKAFFLRLFGWVQNLRAGFMAKTYEEEKHLKRIAKKYEDAAHKISAPHIRWYSVTIPVMDIRVIEKQLLSREEVPRYFRINEKSVQDWITTGKITAYRAGRREFFRKDEITMVIRNLAS